MRIAAIDCGTNSIHMIVVRIRPDLSFEVIDREKEMVRLGSGGLDGKALTTEAMTAALQTFSRFRRLAESHQVEEILAAATSAVRESGNGGEFLTAVERETGIKPQVISGTEEARLIHLAAVYGVDVSGASAVVVDIGGGSVEITHGAGTSLRVAKSFKLGVIRLTERFVHTDPLSRRDERKLVGHIEDELSKYSTRHPERRIRPVDWHVGHDPQPRYDRVGRAPADERRDSEPSRRGQTDSSRAQRGRRPQHCRAHENARHGSAARRSHRLGCGALRHHHAAPRRERGDAMRPRAS